MCVNVSVDITKQLNYSLLLIRHKYCAPICIYNKTLESQFFLVLLSSSTVLASTFRYKNY